MPGAGLPGLFPGDLRFAQDQPFPRLAFGTAPGQGEAFILRFFFGLFRQGQGPALLQAVPRKVPFVRHGAAEFLVFARAQIEGVKGRRALDALHRPGVETQVGVNDAAA